MPKSDPKASPVLREPKPKKLGLAVPPSLRLPHADYIKPDTAPVDSTPVISIPAETTPVESTPAVNYTSEPLENVPAVESTPAAVSAPVPAKKGYLKLPHEIIDNVLPTMRPGEQVAFVQLYRLSHGFGKSTCLISLPTLARKCRLSESQVRIAVRNVEARGYVKQLRIEQGARERGIVFEVWTPSDSTPSKSTPVISTPVKSAPNIKELKEQIKSECLRCKNTGWWYPEGVANGVKRCDHGTGK